MLRVRLDHQVVGTNVLGPFRQIKRFVFILREQHHLESNCAGVSVCPLDLDCLGQIPEHAVKVIRLGLVNLGVGVPTPSVDANLNPGD